METKSDFQITIDSIKNNRNVNTQTTEDIFFDLLCSVPPAAQVKGSFLNGEAYTHDNSGSPVYYCFFKKDNKFFGTMANKTAFDLKIWETQNDINPLNL